MKSATIFKDGHGTHKPLVTSSNLVAATIPLKSSSIGKEISISEAIAGFLLTCSVERKPDTIELYSDSI